MVDKIIHFLNFLVSPKRKEHILSVRDFALILANVHRADPYIIEIVALSHDMFRDVPPSKLFKIASLWNLEITEVERKHPVLLHGKVAAEFVKRRFSFKNKSALLAISFHTSGHPKFDITGKILTVADTVAYDRKFPGVERLRRVSFESIEKAYKEVIKNRLLYAIKSDRYILEASMKTWNHLVDRRDS